MSRRRAAVLIGVNLLMAAHIVQWWVSGRTVSPIEPSETMYTLERGEVNAGFIFFGLAILSTLVLGRWVCGWGCHVVALQDLCGWLMKKAGVKPRLFRSRLLMLVPLGAALYMFVWPSVYRLLAAPAGQRMPAFSNHLLKTEFWETFPSVWVAIPFLLICGFGVVYFLGAKGYCTYACPYGAFFGLSDKLAIGRIRVTDACNGCGHCTAVCTSNVRVHAEVRDHGMVVDPGCMKCMDCVSVCPTNALYYGFGRPSLRKRPEPVAYDLTWPEDLFAAGVFIAALFALRGIYDVIPFLMALGCAGIVSYAAVKLVHLKRRPEVAMQNVKLLAGGRIRWAGICFVMLAGMAMGAVVHCGIVQWNWFLARRDLARIEVPEDVVLTGGDPAPWMSDPGALDRAEQRMAYCDDFGMLDWADLKEQRAWCALVRNDVSGAVTQMRRAHDLRRESDRPRTAYLLGRMLALAGRHEEAVEAYRAALVARFHGRQARQWMGSSLAALGRMEEALACWREVTEIQARSGLLGESASYLLRLIEVAPDRADLHFQLGLVGRAAGDEQTATAAFARAVGLDGRLRVIVPKRSTR